MVSVAGNLESPPSDSSSKVSLHRSPSAAARGFRSGDMVWGKVKSHPWWPGQIYDEAFALPSVIDSKLAGHVLVAFFGDSSYGWLDPADLLPFDLHFPEKSRQSSIPSFLDAVEEATDEAARRAALGLACCCHNPSNFLPSHVPGYFAVDVAGYEPDGVYTIDQIKEARAGVRPGEVLSFVRELAVMPHRKARRSVDRIGNIAVLLAYRRGLFEEFDDTFDEAFGRMPVRLAKDASEKSTIRDGDKDPLAKKKKRHLLRPGDEHPSPGRFKAPFFAADGRQHSPIRGQVPGLPAASKQPLEGIIDVRKPAPDNLKSKSSIQEPSNTPAIAGRNGSLPSATHESKLVFAGSYDVRKLTTDRQKSKPRTLPSTTAIPQPPATTASTAPASFVKPDTLKLKKPKLTPSTTAALLPPQAISTAPAPTAKLEPKIAVAGESNVLGLTNDRLKLKQPKPALPDSAAPRLPSNARETPPVKIESSGESKPLELMPVTDKIVDGGYTGAGPFATRSSAMNVRGMVKKVQVPKRSRPENFKPNATDPPEKKKKVKLEVVVNQPIPAGNSKKEGDLLTTVNTTSHDSLLDLARDLRALAVDPFHGGDNNAPAIVSNLILEFRKLVYRKSLVGPPADLQESGDVNSRQGAKTEAIVGRKNPVRIPANEMNVLGSSEVHSPSGAQAVTVPGRKGLLQPPADVPGFPIAGRKRCISDRLEESAAKRTKRLEDLKRLATKRKAEASPLALQQRSPNDVSPAAAPAKHKPASKREARPSPTFLVIKFPPGAALPAPSYLKVKFARLGQLDVSGTRVLSETNTCKVLYKYRSDAEAAFKHAETNPMFWETKVKYHLQEAAGASASHPRKPLPDVMSKSCLKKPRNEAGSVDVKEGARVRFSLRSGDCRGGPPVVLAGGPKGTSRPYFAPADTPKAAASSHRPSSPPPPGYSKLHSSIEMRNGAQQQWSFPPPGYSALYSGREMQHEAPLSTSPLCLPQQQHPNRKLQHLPPPPAPPRPQTQSCLSSPPHPDSGMQQGPPLPLPPTTQPPPAPLGPVSPSAHIAVEHPANPVRPVINHADEMDGAGESKVDISDQFMNLLMRCSDVVAAVNSSFGYVSYHAI